jgi:hypothetical protein
LTEPWADTGTSTGRLMLAVLGGLADVERDHIILSAPAPPKAAAARKSAASIWAVPETHRRAKGRGPPATCAARNPCGVGAQLRRGEKHNFAALT